MTKDIEIISEDAGYVEVKLPRLGHQWSFVREDWEALRRYFYDELTENFKTAKIQIPLTAKPKPLFSLGYLQSCLDQEGIDGNMLTHFQIIKEYISLND